VVALFMTVRDYDPWLYRGGFLLMALVGVALVAAASQPAGMLGRALGWEPVRWLGARSYGIYLWHWPIMQLTRPGADVPVHGALLILLQALATVGAAALSYRYVEAPFRSGDAQRRLRAFLDRHTPHQRLAWVSGGAATMLCLAGIGFGLPAPVAAAVSSTATASARQKLSGAAAGSASDGLLGSSLIGASGSGLAVPSIGDLGVGGAHGRALPPGSSTTPPGAGQRHPAVPRGEVLAIGDSVMLGCAQDLEALIGRRLRVDAVVGRQADAAIARLAQYRAARQLPSTVIVQIGDNGPVWYADMQRLRRVLRGVAAVVLVNVRLARSWQDEVNSELRSYARTWPQAVIADWFDHSSQSMLSDGVHPAYSAQPVYARVVHDALAQAERRAAPGGRSSGEPARR
jgi:hypothetical protein